jgi:futalosine hydrolase
VHLLLTAATPFEIAPFIQYLETHCTPTAEGTFAHPNGWTAGVLVTGVGLTATAWHIGRALALQHPDLVLNAGIAGAFDRTLALGDVVQVVAECFGDLGVEEADGSFTDLVQLGLLQADTPPYRAGWMWHPQAGDAHFLRAVRGLSVNKVHGTAASVTAIRAKYPDAQIESMEGAAFFYACLLARVPFLAIRSISNYVEPRNRAAWQLPLAIKNLNEVLIQMADNLR